MSVLSASPLPHRSLIRIGGADRVAFLQGIVSNDVTKATAGVAVHAALLTPQGKFLHDMFITARGDAFVLECERDRAGDLLQRLTAYKLRAKVTFEDLSAAHDVWAVWGGEYRGDGFVDPRLPELGVQVYVDKGSLPANVTITDFATYDRHRLALGVADGSRDMEIGKSTLAEGNFDLLNGVDWKKGCYVGQELTARVHYRGLVKKRLFPVTIDGAIPPPGAVFDGGGEMRSHNGDSGLALVPVEAARQALHEKKPLTCGETRIWPRQPGWMKIDAGT